MKTIAWYPSTHRQGFNPNTLHVEADGCIVDIQVGLHDIYGHKVTRVDVSPHDQCWSDSPGEIVWKQAPGDPRVIRMTQEEASKTGGIIVPDGYGIFGSGVRLSVSEAIQLISGEDTRHITSLRVAKIGSDGLCMQFIDASLHINRELEGIRPNEARVSISGQAEHEPELGLMRATCYRLACEVARAGNERARAVHEQAA